MKKVGNCRHFIPCEDSCLNVIAEGIEMQEQIDILLSYGCNEGQGYFFSKPTTPELCVEMMNKSTVSE